MATEAFKKTDISLQDGHDVTLRPLPVARLRRFLAAWEAGAEIEDKKEDADGFGVLINCCGIALEHEFKGKFDALKASVDEAETGEFLSKEYREHLEDVLDLDTIFVILEVAGGIKLNDPKLLDPTTETPTE